MRDARISPDWIKRIKGDCLHLKLTGIQCSSHFSKSSSISQPTNWKIKEYIIFFDQEHIIFFDKEYLSPKHQFSIWKFSIPWLKYLYLRKSWLWIWWWPRSSWVFYYLKYLSWFIFFGNNNKNDLTRVGCVEVFPIVGPASVFQLVPGCKKSTELLKTWDLK